MVLCDPSAAEISEALQTRWEIQRVYPRSSSRSALASLRSAVSKPSVNQLQIAASIARASSRRSVSRSSRAQFPPFRALLLSDRDRLAEPLFGGNEVSTGLAKDNFPCGSMNFGLEESLVRAIHETDRARYGFFSSPIIAELKVHLGKRREPPGGRIQTTDGVETFDCIDHLFEAD